MADLNNDIRLAVDTGSVAVGSRETMRAIHESKAKLIVISAKGKGYSLSDIVHACAIAKVKLVRFSGNSAEFGTVCGRPHSVASIAVIEPGSSNILNENY